MISFCFRRSMIGTCGTIVFGGLSFETAGAARKLYASLFQSLGLPVSIFMSVRAFSIENDLVWS